jgi:hypothetical protein
MILWIKALFHQVKGLRNLAFIYRKWKAICYLDYIRRSAAMPLETFYHHLSPLTNKSGNQNAHFEWMVTTPVTPPVQKSPFPINQNTYLMSPLLTTKPSNALIAAHSLFSASGKTKLLFP